MEGVAHNVPAKRQRISSKGIQSGSQMTKPGNNLTRKKDTIPQYDVIDVPCDEHDDGGISEGGDHELSTRRSHRMRNVYVTIPYKAAKETG